MQFTNKKVKSIDAEFIVAGNMYVDTLYAVHTQNFWQDTPLTEPPP